MTKFTTCFIGLGSNLDSPIEQVQRAFSELDSVSGIEVKQTSSLYRSAPVGPQDQPDFINAVVEISTSLAPHALLDQLQSIEQAHQRKRLQHWGPRTLDLDLLIYGNQVINDNRLVVPHTFLQERGFVLLPLFEIAPQCALPCGTRIRDLINKGGLGRLERI